MKAPPHYVQRGHISLDLASWRRSWWHIRRFRQRRTAAVVYQEEPKDNHDCYYAADDPRDVTRPIFGSFWFIGRPYQPAQESLGCLSRLLPAP
jgi:hypothetical protein